MNEDLEKESCFICGEKHTIEHYKTKGLYRGKYGHDEPFPSYYICYCESCNKEYQKLKQKARDTQYKFEKQLLSKIRSAIKRHCKTLSIRISHSVWDVSISPLIKDHNYRNFSEEELKTLVKFRIFDSTKYKTNCAFIEDMYYFYLTRKDLIETKIKKEIVKMQTSKTNGLTLKILENGELASYIPKKVWYALFKQGIIVKENSKWIVDLSKKDQIKIPIEIVEKSEIKQKNSHSHLTEHKQYQTKTKKKNKDFEDFKTIVKKAIEYANNKMDEFLENREENLPAFAIGEPEDMIASLKGKSTRLKSVDSVMYGSSGFCWIVFWNLNTYFGRMVRSWEKKEPDNVLGFQKGSSRYGHSLYPKINGTHTQITEQKAEGYKHFISKLNELFKEIEIEIPSLYVKTHLT